jgi:glycosyltransferase involved in cell wall biosynthesis
VSQPATRIAIFDNLANNAYNQAVVMRRLGHEVDVVLDPFDRYVMSDPRWEELDLELPTREIATAELPACELPPWVRSVPDRPESHGPIARRSRLLREVPRVWPGWGIAARAAGWRGARMVLERSWVVRTLAGYDCVLAYGAGPIWATVAGVPFIAETWGGDITMVPFYDTGDWEGHGAVPLPGPRAELFALARLQRMGYAHATRILVTDPRFLAYTERLGHSAKSVHLGFVIDTDRYAPGAEPELRRALLGDRDGVIVFVPSRQDWYWKGSDRLLRGFAAALGDREDVVLVCAGWGTDLERSVRLVDELGIAARVTILPHVLSKGRLRRYYRACDIIADQFTVGSYGAAALEAMSCGRPLLISLDPVRFADRFASFPPVVNVSQPEEIATALARLVDDPEERGRVGARAREWTIANHGPALVRRVLDLCHAAVSEAGRHRPRRGV